MLQCTVLYSMLGKKTPVCEGILCLCVYILLNCSKMSKLVISEPSRNLSFTRAKKCFPLISTKCYSLRKHVHTKISLKSIKLFRGHGEFC